MQGGGLCIWQRIGEPQLFAWCSFGQRILSLALTRSQMERLLPESGWRPDVGPLADWQGRPLYSATFFELVEEEQVEDGRILLEQLGVGEKIMAGGQLLSNDRCQLLWVGHLCQLALAKSSACC